MIYTRVRDESHWSWNFVKFVESEMKKKEKEERKNERNHASCLAVSSATQCHYISPLYIGAICQFANIIDK